MRREDVQSWFCWDLDSTLCDTRHRQHMAAQVREKKATWLEYSLACADDEPIEGAVAMVRFIAAQDRLIGIAGAYRSTVSPAAASRA